MLMTAYIVSAVEGSSGYEWNIYIPQLFGLPEDKAEKLLFDRYKEQSNVKTTSKEVKNDLLSVLLRSFRKTKTVAKVSLTDEQKRFNVVARVVGIPGTFVLYQPGDVVVVGFENNDMMKPLIIGSLLTKDISTETRMIAVLDQLGVKQKAVLPLQETVYQYTGDVKSIDNSRVNSFTAEDVADVIKFQQVLKESNLDAAQLIELLGRLNALLPITTDTILGGSK